MFDISFVYGGGCLKSICCLSLSQICQTSCLMGLMAFL